jgi:hypothetical protein
LQNYTTYIAGVLTDAKDTKVARSLIAHFTTPDAIAALKAIGMEPATR